MPGRASPQLSDALCPEDDAQDFYGIMNWFMRRMTHLHPPPGTKYRLSQRILWLFVPFALVAWACGLPTNWMPFSATETVPASLYPSAYPVAATNVPSTEDIYPPASTSNNYPGAATESPSIYPGVGVETASLMTPSSTATGQTPSPTFDSQAVNRTATADGLPPYPGVNLATNAYPLVNTPYPGSIETQAMGETITPTASNGFPLTATPTSTGQFFQPALASPSPSAPVILVTATPSPFLTPTPSPTATPTITPTPLPPPPWVRVPLRATDPRTVRLASGKVQLIEFFAFWSGPSQAMAPLIQGIENEYRERVNFIYLDIDDPATNYFKRELGFRMEPHFFLLDAQGRILQQWVGYVSVTVLRQALDAALSP